MIRLTCATFLIGPHCVKRQCGTHKMKIIVHLFLEEAVFFGFNHIFLTLNTLPEKKKKEKTSTL